MSNLLNSLIRLAHAQPALRKDLLPLIKEAAGKVSDKDIKALQQEAAQAGDTKMVKDCKAALNGDAKARQRCVDAIEDAKAMDDD